MRNCIPFAFQSKKNVAEAMEMICAAPGEDVVTHKMCKKWYQGVRNWNINVSDWQHLSQAQIFSNLKVATSFEVYLKLSTKCASRIGKNVSIGILE